ncbi:MAG: DUF167 family protein [Patescibacteria group bacterium]
MPNTASKLIKLQVIPNSKKSSIQKTKDGYLVMVSTSAKHNQANQEVFKLVKEEIGCKRIQLVSGQHKTKKIIRISN